MTLLSGVSSKYSCTVCTAICAALSFGKQNTPVDIQQNATLSSPYADASSRQDKVTGPKQCAMFLRQLSLHNRTYGMQDITAGQIVSFRDLRLSGGFLMPLFSHFASPMLVSALFTLSCIEIIISPIAGIRKAGTIKCPGYPKDTIGTNI